jgi:hypothetical protein
MKWAEGRINPKNQKKKMKTYCCGALGDIFQELLIFSGGELVLN